LREIASVVPGLVREVRIGRHAVDFNAELLEIGVAIGQVTQFGRANKREVGRIENENRPLALQAFFSDGHEFAVVISLCLERFDLTIDDRHLLSPLSEWLESGVSMSDHA
jgi:hypothetical protein